MTTHDLMRGPEFFEHAEEHEVDLTSPVFLDDLDDIDDADGNA